MHDRATRQPYLVYLRRIDEKLDRVLEEIAGIGRIDVRLERIEKRLDLVEA